MATRAPTGDGHVERRLNLAQVGIERAAQIGQTLIVERLEVELRGVRCFALRAGEFGSHQGSWLESKGSGGCWSGGHHHLATQRVRQGGRDGDIDELPDQAPGGGCGREVDDSIVLGAAGKLVHVFLRAPLHQHALYCADHGGADRGGLSFSLRLQAFEACELDLLRRVVRQVGSGGTGAPAVDKAERAIDIEVFDQPHRCFKISVSLAGKADDEVR